MEQAKNIPALLGDDYPKIQRVLCSPLKRALETAVLAFANTSSSSSVSIPIDIHYDLREIGDASIPENQPLAETVSSFVEQYECIRVLPATATSSEALLLHSQWPRRHDASPKVLRRNQVRRLVSDYIIRQQQMLLEKEEEKLTCIAVVCHYHVIRAALSDPYDIRGSMVQPKNAMPIRCVLDEYGILEPVLL
jgi:broad specificity phosphatase PhoE